MLILHDFHNKCNLRGELNTASRACGMKINVKKIKVMCKCHKRTSKMKILTDREIVEQVKR